MRLLTAVILTLACLPRLAAQRPSSRDSSSVVTLAGRGADSVLSVAARDGFTGAALIIRDGQVILRRGYGLTNKAERIPFTPATVVQIGSNTKDFTQVAILQLLERKALALADSITRFIPDVPDDKRGITIMHLLRHRSGLDIGVGPDFEPLKREQFVERALHAPLLSPPGSRERYSNAGYGLLAVIIEKLSGQAYDEYVRDHILLPLGMTETGLLLPRFDERRLAHGYASGADRGTMLDRPHAADGPHWNLRGNGGMLSTLDDMATFYHALFDGDRLLKPATRGILFRDEPTVLAGSDLVNFFLYHREPAERLEVYLASTTAEFKAPVFDDRLMRLFGLVRDDPRNRAAAANARPIDLPPTDLGRVAAEYVRVFNDGDSTARHRFLGERVVPNPSDGRTVAERVAAMREMRDRLGRIVPIGFDPTAPTQGDLRFQTQEGDPAVITIEIEASAPYRIRSIRIRVG